MTDGIESQTQSDTRGPAGKSADRSGPSDERHSSGDEEFEQEQLVEQDEFQSSRAELSAVVSEFRDSKLSRSRAISRISSIIDGNSSVSDIKKEKAIDLYLSELTAIQLGRTARPLITKRKENQAVDDSVFDMLDQISSKDKRSREGSVESDGADGSPSKKRRFTEAELPPGWTVDPVSSDPDDASFIETCKQIKVYTRDVSGARSIVRMSRNAPTGIPNSQWDRILRGEVLDLDHFLSALHRTTVSEEGETRIGNAKISFGVADAKRRVTTAADWSSAWQLASEAIEFAFPHRARELVSYGKFISGEFTAKLASSHPRVILYDIAIRNVVQGGQCTLLTDQQLHMRFWSSILMPDAFTPSSTGVVNRKTIQSRAGGSKVDVCNRFNGINGCPSSDADCRYRHICKKCKKAGHGREQCPTNK